MLVPAQIFTLSQLSLGKLLRITELSKTQTAEGQSWHGDKSMILGVSELRLSIRFVTGLGRIGLSDFSFSDT